MIMKFFYKRERHQLYHGEKEFYNKKNKLHNKGKIIRAQEEK